MRSYKLEIFKDGSGYWSVRDSGPKALAIAGHPMDFDTGIPESVDSGKVIEALEDKFTDVLVSVAGESLN